MVICTKCYRHCSVADMERLPCRQIIKKESVNVTGKIISCSLVYPSQIPSIRLKAAEKVLLVELYGCLMECDLCKSRARKRTSPADIQDISVQELMDKALVMVPYGLRTIVFAGQEPMLQYPFVLAAAKSARQFGLQTAVKTGGRIPAFIYEQLKEEIGLWIVDLKFTSSGLYALAGGSLPDVLDFCRQAAAFHPFELSMQVLKGINDDPQMLGQLLQRFAGLIPQPVLSLSQSHGCRQTRYHKVSWERMQILADQARTMLNEVQIVSDH